MTVPRRQFLQLAGAGALPVLTRIARAQAYPTRPVRWVIGYPAGGGTRNTPIQIIEKLNKEINAALADPRMKARLADLGGTPLPGSPADFGKLIAQETEKWGKVIRAANIKPE